jgi:hypothetical protein
MPQTKLQSRRRKRERRLAREPAGGYPLLKVTFTNYMPRDDRKLNPFC